MIFNTPHMKAIRITFLFFSTVFLCSTINAQTTKTDSIFWTNGNVSFLSDLNGVWIILKNGGPIKDVRITEIKKQKGTLVYEKEKCLHDVSIGNIKKIQAGKHTLSTMYFFPDNTPYIKKEYLQMDAMLSYSDFKSVKGLTPLATDKKETISTKEKPEGYTMVTGSLFPNTDTNLICDTLKEENGAVTLAKIIEINSKIIRYKKIMNFYGPVYIKSSKDAQVTKYDNCYTVAFFEKN